MLNAPTIIPVRASPNPFSLFFFNFAKPILDKIVPTAPTIPNKLISNDDNDTTNPAIAKPFVFTVGCAG